MDDKSFLAALQGISKTPTKVALPKISETKPKPKPSSNSDDTERQRFEGVGVPLNEDVGVASAIIKRLFEWMEDPKGHRATQAPRAVGRHASSLFSTCGRRRILDRLFKASGELIEEDYTASNTLTFGIGHALHDLWQNEYLGKSGLMFGLWDCYGCGTQHEGVKPPVCPKCSSDKLFHAEYGIHIPEMNLYGHCDGVVINPDEPKHYVFEFKTKSSSQYSKLSSPQIDHVWQVHCYMKGVRDKGLQIEGAIVVYVDKGKQATWRKKKAVWTCGPPHVKQYDVQWSDELWQYIERVVEQDDRAIADIELNAWEPKSLTGEEAAKVLENYERRCPSKGCTLADSCQLVEECFATPAAPWDV